MLPRCLRSCARPAILNLVIKAQSLTGYRLLAPAASSLATRPLRHPIEPPPSRMNTTKWKTSPRFDLAVMGVAVAGCFYLLFSYLFSDFSRKWYGVCLWVFLCGYN